MDKIICPKCGGEVSNEFGVTLSYCTNCGEGVQLREEKTVLSNNAPAPKTKSQLPTILATSFFTALFLILLFAGGAYWFINRSGGGSSIAQPTKQPGTANPKLTPRTKNRSSISAADITRIEFTQLTSATQSSAAQFFGNVNPNNFLTRTSIVSFSADGNAVKTVSKSGTLNGSQISPTTEKYAGAITREKFLELAQVFIENDFTGEENSKTSSSLPINYTLKVAYSSGEKIIKTSNMGDDTPEAAAMLQAFKNLENQVGWKME